MSRKIVFSSDIVLTQISTEKKTFLTTTVTNVHKILSEFSQSFLTYFAL